MGFIINNYRDIHDKLNEEAYARIEVYKVDQKRNKIRIYIHTYSSMDARADDAKPIIVKHYTYPANIFGDCISLYHIYKVLNKHEDWQKENIESAFEVMKTDTDKYDLGKEISIDIANKEKYENGVEYEIEKDIDNVIDADITFDDAGNIISDL